MSTQPLSSRELYFRLLSYVRPYWKIFVLAMVCMAASAATEPLFPALMGQLLDVGFGAGKAKAGAEGQAGEFLGRLLDGTNPYVFPVLIIAIFLSRSILGFIADYLFSWVSNRVVTNLRDAMFDRMVTLPTSYFDNQSTGALISKIAYDVSGVTAAATNVVTVMVKDSMAVIGLLVWLMWLNWSLTLIVLVMIPVIALAVRVFSRRLRDVSRGAQKSFGFITHVLEESIAAHKVVKIFGGQDYERQRFHAANNRQRGFNMRYTVAAGTQGPMVQFAAAVVLAIIVTITLHQSATDKATVGGFVSFMMAMLMLLAPLKRLTDINAPLQRGLAAAESVFELMDETPEDDRGTRELGRAAGALGFDNVTFAYPGANRPALEGITLDIRPGETVALVGASGSGKTTIANLVPRFYHPSSGRILVDGADVESIRLVSLRANVALVSQDVVLFNDTVAANIAYGAMSGATREQVREAARAAHALDFIEAMSEGFDTLIGENGVKLSGGQRQRLAIARAILKDAPILVLDEATSALDTESERRVQAALDELMKDRTTLVIAHRLSTIENADRIVVMDRGRIVEVGSHGELLARDGVYAKLHRIQYALEAADQK